MESSAGEEGAFSEFVAPVAATSPLVSVISSMSGGPTVSAVLPMVDRFDVDWLKKRESSLGARVL